MTDINPGSALLTSKFSNGATVIAPVNVKAVSPTSKINLISVGFTSYLTKDTQGSAFGKLGKLIGGLSPGDDNIVGFTGATKFNQKMLPLPADPTLTVILYDPEVNPGIPENPMLPGALPAPGQCLPVSGTISPPLPIPVYPGTQIAVGLWLTPSLIGYQGQAGTPSFEFQVFVSYSTFSVVYDDGS